MSGFSDKVVLVTGGASGIGAAAVRAFAAAGAAVMVADILPQDLHLATSMRIAEYDLSYHQVDVTSATACQGMVNACIERFGRLDVAVNNVGVVDPDFGPEDILTVKDWDRTVSLSLSSTFYCIRAQLDVMLASGGGSIVNTASVAGLVSLPRKFAYVSAKHGVVGLTKAVCDVYASHNIRCNAVAPGIIETPGLLASRRGSTAPISALAERIPMGRLGTADEIAQAILWLASDAAAYVNGTTLTVDGGYVVR